MEEEEEPAGPSMEELATLVLREAELGRLNAEQVRRGAELDAREAELSRREAEVSRREAAFARRETEVRGMEAAAGLGGGEQVAGHGETEERGNNNRCYLT